MRNARSAPRARSTAASVAGLAMAAFVAACGAADRTADLVTVRDSADITIVENRMAAMATVCPVSPEPRVDIGVVEGDDAYQLYGVADAAVVSDDGRIAVVNQGANDVRVFEATGRHLFTFGREGDGPGEFSSMFRIWRGAGDTLIVADQGPWSHSYFTPDGDFVRSVIVRPEYINVPRTMGLLADGSFVFGQQLRDRTPESGFEATSLQVLRHAPDGIVRDTIGVFPYQRYGYLSAEIGLVGAPVFEPRTQVTAAGERIVVGLGIEREFELRDGDGRLARLVRWTGEDLTVGPADVEAFKRQIREQYESYADDVWRQWGEPQIDDDRPVNERFPAHNRIVTADDGGRTWVQEFDRPSREGPDRWLVFEADGRFRCGVDVPDGLRVFDVGDDYVLGRATDELDVEHVRLYEVAAPVGPDG